MFVSFPPLTAFPHKRAEGEPRICYVANRNGDPGFVRLDCLFKTL